MDPIIGVALTVLGVLISAYLTSRVSNRKLKSDSGMQLLDQHQEDLIEMRKQIAVLQKQMRIQGDYIGQLRRHIADGSPPPPPSWPDSLIA